MKQLICLIRVTLLHKLHKRVCAPDINLWGLLENTFLNLDKERQDWVVKHRHTYTVLPT